MTRNCKNICSRWQDKVLCKTDKAIWWNLVPEARVYSVIETSCATIEYDTNLPWFPRMTDTMMKQKLGCIGVHRGLLSSMFGLRRKRPIKLRWSCSVFQQRLNFDHRILQKILQLMVSIKLRGQLTFLDGKIPWGHLKLQFWPDPNSAFCLASLSLYCNFTSN